MGDLVDSLRQANYEDRVFNERQLASVLGPGAARRYGLVNRALKDGSLIRIRRGLYALRSPYRPPYRPDVIHPFAVAQALLLGSYISFETALAYHGWIPEAVYVTASVSPRRKSLNYDGTPFGAFIFHPLATCRYRYLAGVERKKVGKLIAFIASPLRALLDLVALRKIQWTNLDWVTQGMRIEEDHLLTLSEKDFTELENVYQHKAARNFLDALKRDVMALKLNQMESVSDD